MKAGTAKSKASTNKKGRKSGISLKNIECDVFSTPILESRTRKGIIKGSTSSVENTTARGQEEKKSFIKKINTLQALVDGNKVISVTVIPPMNSKGSQKLKAKPTVLGLDVKAPMATVTVARKQVAGEDLQNKGKYRKLITNEWIENQFVLLMEMNRLWVQLGRSRNLFAPREGWLSIIPTDPSDMNYAY